MLTTTSWLTIPADMAGTAAPVIKRTINRVTSLMLGVPPLALGALSNACRCFHCSSSSGTTSSCWLKRMQSTVPLGAEGSLTILMPLSAVTSNNGKSPDCGV